MDNLKALYSQIDHIVTIRVFDRRKQTYYKYIDTVVTQKVYKKWWHWWIRKPEIQTTHYKGWHTMHIFDPEYVMDYFYTADTLSTIKDLLVDGENVYSKPQIVFKFSNKDEFHKCFNTMDDLQRFLQPILSKNKSLIPLTTD